MLTNPVETPKSFWQRMRVAAFSDVPAVFDGVWRHADFYINRLGRVSFRTPDHTFQPRVTTPWAFFIFYLVISLFVVFGPTFTTVCTSFGLSAAERVRLGLGVMSLCWSVILAHWSLSAVTSCLVSRAAHQHPHLKPQMEPENEAQSMRQALGSALQPIIHPKRYSQYALAEVKGLGRAGLEFIQTFRRMNCQTRQRFLAAFLVLLLGVAVAVLPFGFAGAYLVTSPYDSDVCGEHRDTWRGLSQVLAICALALFGAWLWFWKRPAKGFAQLWSIFGAWALVTAALDYGVANASGREADGGPYPQTYSIVLLYLFIVILIARPFARRVLRNINDDSRRVFRRALRRTELFDDNAAPIDTGTMRIASAFVNGLMYRPLQLALFPSLVAITLPSQHLLFYACLAFFVAWFLLAHANIARRWEAPMELIDRWFLSGTPLLVSLLVMLLATARLFQFSYVSTVLDAAPFGIISILVVTAYSTLWFFEYWINRWIAESLLSLLERQERAGEGNCAYRYRPACGEQPLVLRAGRNIALHGTGQFCAQGLILRYSSADGKPYFERAFATFRLLELFERLAGYVPAETVHDLQRRVRFFYACINIILLALFGGLLFWQHSYKVPLAAFHVVDANDALTVGGRGGDLGASLVNQAIKHEPALIVAASGGGTRAALYTATALEGLAEIDQANNIVLLSGVSGGGVAAAYFASAFNRLGTGYQKSDWQHFKHIVTEPFIEDVLNGAAELRIAGNVPLGELLAESFDRRIFTAANGSVKQFKDLSGPALILNTSISGHPWEVSEVLKDRVGVIQNLNDCLQKSQLYSLLAGGRLIFTNLTEFPKPQMVMPDVGLTYKVVHDPNLSLASAAALNANFPPVFSNARVRIQEDGQAGCKGYSYFVTDGGATENLGLVSALYALRGVLKNWHNRADSNGKLPALPHIEVVAIEASAISYDYEGAASGGSKEQNNGALTRELVDSINALLIQLNAAPLHMHYLPLPVAFRSRGGFGTHWMYADHIRVTNPLLATVPNPLMQWIDERIYHRNWSAVLGHEDIDRLWTALFDPHLNFCTAPIQSEANNVAMVAGWVCGKDATWDLKSTLPDLNVCAWRDLIDELADKQFRNAVASFACVDTSRRSQVAASVQSPRPNF